MPFLPPNQQRQSTEDNKKDINCIDGLPAAQPAVAYTQ